MKANSSILKFTRTLLLMRTGVLTLTLFSVSISYAVTYGERDRAMVKDPTTNVQDLSLMSHSERHLTRTFRVKRLNTLSKSLSQPLTITQPQQPTVKQSSKE